MSVTASQNETIVSTTLTSGDIVRPQISRLNDAAGNYIGTVAVWVTQNLGNGWDIVMQRFDAAGAKVGVETVVNTTLAGNQSEPYVATLPNGLFVIGWEGNDSYGRGAFVQAFKSDGTMVGSETKVSDDSSIYTYGARVAAVNGGFIVTMTGDNVDGSAQGIVAQRVAITGNATSGYGVALASQAGAALAAGTYGNFVVNLSTDGYQQYDKATSLANGGALILYTSPDSNQQGIYGRFMAANGTLGAEVHISSEAGSTQIWPEAVQLANGNIFVAWTSNGQDGSGYGIYGRIINAAGAFVTDEFRINDFTVGNQGYSNYADGPKLALLDDGSVIVTFLSDSANYTEVYGRRFKADGSPDGASIQLNQASEYYQSNNGVVATPGGFRAIWMSDAGHYGSYDAIQRDFTYSGTIASTQPIVRTLGEDQVNQNSTYQQQNSQVISRADGSYVILWASSTELGTGDGAGWGIFAQRYSAAGVRVGGEFQINQASDGDQLQFGAAMLSDGRFVVTWQTGSDNVGSTDSFYRIFNASGIATTNDARVNADAGVDQYPGVTALSTGGFVIAWNTYFYNGAQADDVYLQRFDSTGAAVGGEIRVTEINGANTVDGSEFSYSGVLALDSGRFVALYNDYSGEDGSSIGAYARIYEANGTAGTIFQLNSYTDNAQSDVQAAKLAGGGFVAVWDSFGQDTSYDGIYARVFSASGAPVTAEFKVASNAQYGQYSPEVATLADGSFVVVWRSDHDDGFGGSDIYAARYSATGVQLNQEFRINAETVNGNQVSPDVAATENGFVVTWTDENNNYDGDQSGVFRQEFAVDGLTATATGERAERPLITLGTNLIVNPGAELGPTASDYATTATPQGWTVVSGNFTAVKYAITPNDGLGPADSAPISGGADYFAGGPNNASSSVRQTINVASQATMIDTGAISARLAGEFGGFAGDGDNLTMTVRYLSATGTFLGESTIGGVGPGERGSISQLLHREDADLLPIGTRSIEVTLLAIRTNGVYNDAYADNLSLVLSSFGIGAEDSAIPIPLTITTQDANPSTPESLSRIEITGLPVGATLSDGTNSFTASVFADSVTITSWNRATLTVTPPADAESDFTLEIRATSTEPATGDTATSVATFTVDVLPRIEPLVRDALPTRINSTLADNQSNVEIARDTATGTTVAVWQSYNQDGDRWGIYLQRYSSTGAILGTETLVNTVGAGNQINPDVSYLASGKFVVAWLVDGTVMQRVFNANGTAAGGDVRVDTPPGPNSPDGVMITALSTGGWLTSWSGYGAAADPSANGVFAQRYNAAGVAVSRDGATSGADIFLINTYTNDYQDEQSIAATADGGFVAAWTSYNQAGDAIDGVFAQRFSAAGAKIGGEFNVAELTDNSQRDPQVTILTNGNILITWYTDTTQDADNSGNGIAARLYNAVGVALTGEFQANTFTTGSQYSPSVVALPGGGFAMAWTADGRANAADIVVQVFDAEGDRVGDERVVSNIGVYGNEYSPSLIYDGTGLTLAWHSDAADGSSYGIQGRRISLAPVTVEATGGARVVPTTTPYGQQQGDVATLADGSYVVVWSTQPVPGYGDNSSYSVRAQHFAAGGARVGAEFTVNTNTAYDQSGPSITALDGGDYIVVWHSQTGDGAGYGIFAQRFNPDDSKDGAEFRINADAAGDQLWPQVTALHGAQAGGFAVTWQASDNIYARAFDATNTAIGGDLAVSQQIERVTNLDSSEIAPHIAAGLSGGFTVVWQDGDGDKNGNAVIGQRYSISGGVVTALGGVNSDGTASASNFRINTPYIGNQYLTSIATLGDGATIVVWYDEPTSHLKGQLFNTNGTRRGGEIALTPNAPGYQYEPSVASLPDGGFVVIWRDDLDGAASSVRGARYSAAGAQIDSFTVANDIVSRYQFNANPIYTSFSVEAQGDGFNVVFTARNGIDGFDAGLSSLDSNAVVLQHFTVDYGPSGGQKVAQLPTLTLAPVVTGAEDTSIALAIAGALNNSDGGSETLKLVIENVPVGARITDGTRTFIATAQQPALDLTGWTLATLRITPPADYNGSFTLNVSASATEAQGDVAFNNGTIKVVVTPVDEVLPAFAAERQDNVATYDSQWQPAVASQADGRYLVVWRSQSQPNQPNPTTMAQLHAANGDKIGSEFSVNVTNSYNYDPRVVALADGSYLVAFTANDGNSNGVFAQRVSAGGQLLDSAGGTGTAAAIQLNTVTAADQQSVDIAALADGGWVATWTAQSVDGAEYGIAAQRFAANGSKVGGEFVVNTTTAGAQYSPEVAQLADGSIVYTWYGPTGVFARVFRADGTIGPEIALGVGDLPSIEALPNGSFVVAWQAGGDVVAQRVNADGSLAGASFRVNSYTNDQQQEPQIAKLPDGGFVVAWTSANQDGSSWGVYGQRYDALGGAIGTEYRVNRTIVGDQSSPVIVAQGDGSGLIVAFEGQDGNGYGVYDIRLPIADATIPPAIQRAQTEVQVNDPDSPSVLAEQSQGDVTKLADGSYIVSYTSNGQDGSSYGVYARHYEADGDPILWGGTARELRLNFTTVSSQFEGSTVALPGGGFVVVYRSDHNYNAIYARQFDSAGNVVQLRDASGTLVDELKLSNETTHSYTPSVSAMADGSFSVVFNHDGDVFTRHVDATGQLTNSSDVALAQNVDSTQEIARITALAGGGYVAVWRSFGHDGSSWGVYGRMLDANGAPQGNEFLINTFTDGEQREGSVAALTNGGFVVVWQSYTGYDDDQSGWGISGQRYTVSNGLAVRTGAEFEVNGIAYSDQIEPTVVGSQDGGFLVAWRSYAADNDGYAIVGRRFDSAGNPTEPYGNDFVINTTTAGDQSQVSLATLDRGFVAVWSSSEQGYNVRMQRFEGAGLEPPPYVVDPLTGNDTNVDHVYATIQQALDAAPAGQTIRIKGGTYSEALIVHTDDLKLVNAPGETVTITAPSGAIALTVNQGLNLTIRGETAASLIFQGAAGQDAVRFLGDNDGTEISKATIVSAAAGQGLVIRGGLDGLTLQDSAFTGANNLTLLGADAGLGLGGSSGAIVQRNSFSTSGGYAIASAATLGKIVQNVFDGQASPAAASVQLSGAGVDFTFNRFQAGTGPHFRDLGSNYDESAVIAGNSFPEGWVRVGATNVLYATITQALNSAVAGDTVSISGGAWSEGVVTAPVNDLKISAPAGLTPATGVSLLLGTGVAKLTLQDGANIAATGNALANTITGNAGDNVLSGDDGADVLTGNGGRDTLNGGAGDDQLTVTIDGGAADAIDGGTGNDLAFVVTTGSASSYTLAGTTAVATISSTGDGIARATLTGVEIISVVLSYSESLTVGALPGVSQVIVSGSASSNTLNTTASTSEVYFAGGAGNDTFVGGAALDGILYSNQATAVAVNLSGTAFTFGGNTIAAGTARDQFGNIDTLSGIDYVQTGDGNDRVDGGALGETILTGLGNDTVNGGGGDDRIFAGTGTNTLAGGAGNDIYYIESATDTISEAAGAANGTADKVVTALGTFSIAAFANVEGLEADGNAAHTFTGNAGANRIVGAAGNDSLNGGVGNDVLIGGLGTNTLNGGADFDTADYSALTSAVSASIAAGTATSTGVSDTLVAIERLIGGSAGDTLIGAAGSETLEGGDGDDILQGGAAADTLIGGAGSDIVLVAGGPANGMLVRTGAGAWTLASASDGTDAVQTIEAIKFLGADAGSAADDRTFAIVAGNVAVQSAADTGSATEAGGVANGTASVPATGNVLANDINLDESSAAGDVMKVATIGWTSATGPGTGTGGSTANVAATGTTSMVGRYGTLSIAANGAYTYTPDAAKSDLLGEAQTASEVFTYTANDGIGAAATTTLTITLTGRNDAPVAVADSAATTENANVSVNVLANDTDVDTGATKTLVSASAPAGKGSVSVAGSNVTFSPGTAFDHLAAGVTEMVAISYVMRDENNATATGTLTITVTGTNDAPVASADTAATTENAIVTIDALANDSDVDDAAVKVLVSVAAPAGKGSAAIVNGQVRFDPGTAFDHLAAGATEIVNLTYVMQDQAGAQSTATIAVTVTGTNDAPIAIADVGATTENAAVTVNVTANDIDVDDGAVLTLVSAAAPAGKGSVSVSASGVTFTPGSDFDHLAAGVTETVAIGYVVRDQNNATASGTLTITVTGTNDAPVAVADTATTSENAILVVNPLVNDTDRDDGAVLTLVSVSAPAGKGNATIANGQVRYNPGFAFDHLAAGATEVVNLTYVMKDQAGAQSTATIAVTVTGANDAPVAVADTGATTENAAVTVNVTANDIDVDDGAVLTLVSATAPTGKGSASVSPSGVTFTPGSDFDHLAAGVTETVAIGYVVRDQDNATANGTLTITVTGTNDAPIAVADAATTSENAPLTITPLADDVDGDDGAVLTLVSAVAPAGKGSVTLNGNQLVFNPGTAFDHLAAGASEGVTISYVVKDDQNAQATGTIALTVTGTNDAPVTLADAGTVLERRNLILNPFLNDSDVDDGAMLSVQNVVIGPLRGTATIANNRIVYNSGTDFARLAPGETATINMTYDIVDGQGGVTASSAKITIVGINDRPEPRGELVTGTEDTPLTITTATLLSNDRDPDTSQTLTVTGVSGATHGTVGLSNGVVTFTPDADFFGAGSFRYAVSDGAGGTADALVRVKIAGVDDLGIAVNDAFGTSETRVKSGNLFADNGSGADHDIDSKLRVAGVNGVNGNLGQTLTLASGATLMVNPTGTFSYDPNHAFDGLTGVSGATNSQATDSFTYQLYRGGTATATITVSGVSNSSAVALGSSGNDTLVGTSAAETIHGALGADQITPGGGADVLVYASAAESSGASGYDTVTGFSFTQDLLDVAGVKTDYHRDAAVTNATLSQGTFDSDLTAALAGILSDHGVSFVTASAGGLAGHVFAVIDQNGTAGYQAGADLVIDLVTPSAVPATGVDFLL